MKTGLIPSRDLNEISKLYDCWTYCPCSPWTFKVNPATYTSSLLPVAAYMHNTYYVIRTGSTIIRYGYEEKIIIVYIIRVVQAVPGWNQHPFVRYGQPIPYNLLRSIHRSGLQVCYKRNIITCRQVKNNQPQGYSCAKFLIIGTNVLDSPSLFFSTIL